MSSTPESQHRWGELRDLVNAHDPVQLIAMGCPRDEYDCVTGPLMRSLEQGASADAIRAFLLAHFRDHVGLPISDTAATQLTSAAQAWYAARGEPARE